MLCSLDQSPCGTYTLSQGIWGESVGDCLLYIN